MEPKVSNALPTDSLIVTLLFTNFSFTISMAKDVIFTNTSKTFRLSKVQLLSRCSEVFHFSADGLKEWVVKIDNWRK